MEPIKHLITEFRLLAYGVAPQEFEYAKNITDPGEDVTISDLQAHGAIPNYTVRAIPIFFLYFYSNMLVLFFVVFLRFDL